jgi:hypothetical protein
MNMKQEFANYLIGHGYKLTTPSGTFSTVYDYVKRVDKVCEWEGCSWETLAENIVVTVPKYDVGGEKADLGNISRRSVINALKRFKEFVQSR